MSYPKWVTRDVPYDTNYLTNHDACAFTVHDGYLYYLTGDDGLFKVDFWCERGDGTLQVTITQLSDITNGHGYPEGDVMLSALGVLWFTRSGYLYNYDDGAINGPWNPNGGRIFDLAEYGGDIYATTIIASGPYVMGLQRFDVASETWAQVYTGSPVSGFTAGSLASFGGYLYFSKYRDLLRWDGAVAATVYSSGGPEIGIIRASNDVLHVGAGSFTTYSGSHTPRLWAWNGATMSLVVDISGEASIPIAMAYRDNNELYTFCAWTGSIIGWWHLSEKIYKIDPTVGTCVLDDYTPASPPTYSYANDWRSLCYWPTYDSIWAGEQRTKIFDFVPCGIPRTRTYFLLA